MDSKEIYHFEKLVRVVCSVAIMILSVYIGIKLFPFIPNSVKVKISNTTKEMTQSMIEELDLLAGYVSDKPNYPESVQDFFVSILDAPMGIYNYVTSQEKDNIIQKPSDESSSPIMLETSTEDRYEEESSSQSLPTEETNEPSKVVNLIPIQPSIVQDILTIAQNGQIPLENMLNYPYLIKNFYVVDGSTSVTEEVLNPNKLLSKDMTIMKNTNEPQILIYHTHSQEAFANSVVGDVSQTIVGVGSYLTDILTNQYGYNVLHHTGVYDMENGKLERGQAYNRALPAIEAILKQYPSIEVIIDLHRDGVGENVHLVTDVNGKKVARLMFFNGICRDTNGELAELSNPYREDNLAFSLQMGLNLKAAYPEMLRVLYLQKNRYNQHLASRCLLVETGAQTNTVEEAMNAMEILAEILNNVLS